MTGDDRETIDEPAGHELPEIFITAETPLNDSTENEITFVFVFRKNHDGKLAFLDWRPIQDLPDLACLERAWGSGSYCLQGRAFDRKTICRQIFVNVGDERPKGAAAIVPPAQQRAELDITKIATAAGAVLTAVMTPLMTFMDRAREERKAERELERQRLEGERERDESRNSTLLQALTGLMASRNSDLEAIIKGQMGAPKSGGSADAYKEGQMDALQIIEALREGGSMGGDAEVEFLKLAQAFVSGRNAAQSDVRTADKTNGSGGSS